MWLSVTSKQCLTDEDRKIFKNLLENLKKDTKGLNHPANTCMHFSCQQIIGMGPKVLPLIFEDYIHADGGDGFKHWAWPLDAITAIDIGVDSRDGFKWKSARLAWLDWGLQNGFV